MKGYNKPLGEHTIAQCSIAIAKYLQLDSPEKYTSHTYKHSTATLMADNGASVLQLANAGCWKSQNVASGYVQNSTVTKKRAADLIGLFEDSSNKKVSTTSVVHNVINEETKSAAPTAVTNFNFNFSGESSTINIGDFNFPGKEGNKAVTRLSANSYEHQKSSSNVDYNKPYGSFTSAHEDDVFIQLQPEIAADKRKIVVDDATAN
jgi:hypothetical protein